MPYNDMDELESAFRETMARIIHEAGSVENILNDRQRKAILQTIVTTMQTLGMEVETSLPALIAEEYAVGSDIAVAHLTALAATDGGLNTGFNRQIHVAAVQELLLDTGEDLAAAIRTATMSGIGGIENIVKEVTTALGESLITGSPRKVAQKEIQRYFAENGLTAFITQPDSRGRVRRLPLDFYAQTVTRTKRKDANIKGQLNRYTENGVQYVKILPHSPTCYKCAAHFNVIIQISGEPVAGIPHISNTALPPFHPNCKCSMVPIRTLEGEMIIEPAIVDVRTDSQKRAYAAEQKIRRMANEEKKMYMKMQAEGVEGLPATIGAFRRMKRKNDGKWKALQSEYRSVIHTNAAQYQGRSNRDPARKQADREYIDSRRNQ